MLVITTISPSPAPSLSSPGSSQSRSVAPFSHGFPLLWSMVVSSVVLLLACVGFPGLVSVSVSAQDCSLVVPADPLSIKGLVSLWELTGPGCSQNDDKTMTFVQGAVLNRLTGAIYIYDPLVVDGKGVIPGVNRLAPIIPNVNKPDDIVIAYWVQTHATTITLTGAVAAGNCTSGLSTSKFGKFAFCNAWKFFNEAKKLISGPLNPAPLKTGASDGRPCPSIRDFSFIGRDTPATVMTSYLLHARTGATAHNTPINNQICNGQCIVIQSDSSRMLNNVYQTLGCALWAVTDLTDPSNQQQATGLPLNEIQASVYTVNAPSNQVALVPANHPLATIGGDPAQGIIGTPNLRKLNLLRDGLNQPQVSKLSDASTVKYCTSLTQIPPPRLAADADLLRAVTRQGNSKEAANLYALVVKRQIQLYTDLGCPNTVGPVPFTVVPPGWNVNSNEALIDAEPIQPVSLRCTNMFIFDTKCSFLIALLVVGGGIVLGFAGLLILRVLQAWKYGDKAKQQDSTRAAIRV